VCSNHPQSRGSAPGGLGDEGRLGSVQGRILPSVLLTASTALVELTRSSRQSSLPVFVPGPAPLPQDGSKFSVATAIAEAHLVVMARSKASASAPLVTSAGRDHLLLSKQLGVVVGMLGPFASVFVTQFPSLGDQTVRLPIYSSLRAPNTFFYMLPSPAR